jgi:1-pyrroline-5-carboxylate dehydrogenase
MSFGHFVVPTPTNETIREHKKGTTQRASLEAAVAQAAGEVVEIPCVIAGKHIFTGNIREITMPCDHGHVLARVHMAGEGELKAAITAAKEAREDWENLPWEQRVSVFLKAADLLAGPWRDRVNATTMLGQAKTAFQAEIDAACELIDFWKFNASYVKEIYAEQPPVSGPGVWNRVEHRPLGGFVLAIAPFNFTSISLNLPTAPAMVGNTVVWKPATTGVLSSWVLMQLLEEAGLPAGVINMVPSNGSDIAKHVTSHPDLGGVHFTGSTGTFQSIWKAIGENIHNYKQYPRIVGETGGKDFIAAHPSANPAAVATAILRGAFEYQGQKCSAASRLYLPASTWPAIKALVVEGLSKMKMGDVRDFSNFVGAVIDERAFDKHCEYLKMARETATIVAGGGADKSVGWFIEPTLVQVPTADHPMMAEEIFGPIVTAYVYDDNKWDETLTLVDNTSPYALTGAIFAKDRHVINHAVNRLSQAAGNFYINDKPTGAVVGQQPFGGGRASGTNDKAGSPANLRRWISQRTIKETFVSATEWSYPFMD